ncbi:ATP-binding protein [Desulfonatronum thiodismutans]|uniref:ATP-binding protein n=1 Tax=Desulfonatronum thiodismutans TaxID=159290 RepID=UPI00068DB3D9|nr:ATP-binding protein [Desulfonatronum thiodismutans]
MTHAPRERPEITLRIFLSGLIWVSLLPLLLMGAWLAWDSKRTALMEQENSAKRLASNFMTTMDEYLDARMQALNLLAATPMLDDPARWPEFYALAQSFQRFFDGHVILAEADEPRRMLLNTRAPLGAQLPVLPRADRQSSVSMAIAHGRPAVGDIVFGPVAGEPLNCIAAPVVRHGEIVFVLLSTFATSLLQEQADRFELPPDWAMYLRDGSGNVIAQRLPPEFDVGPDESPERRFEVQSTVGPWFVEMVIPDRVWLSLRVHSAIPILLGLLATTLVGVLGARLASNRLQRAVASLVGPPPTKPAARIVEIEEVRRLLASTQEELRNSELYFQRLFEDAPVALALSNQEGVILSRNTRFDELTGYSADETSTWAEWWSRVCPEPELQTKVLADWESTIATPDATSVEHGIRRKDGAERTVQLFSAGFNSGVLCSFLDVTELRRAEDELRAHQEAKLEQNAEMRLALLNQMQDANAARERAETALGALQESNQRLAAFLRISQAVSSSLETSSVVQAVTDYAVEAMNFSTGAVYLLEGEHVRITAATPVLPYDFPEKFRYAPLIDHPHLAKSLATGKPVVMADTATANLTPTEQEIVRSVNLRSILYLPIRLKDQSLGVLILSDITTARTIQEEEIALLQGFADQAAQVMNNARLYEEVQNHAVQLKQEIDQRKEAKEALRRLNLELEERVHERTKNLEEANKQLEAFSYSVSHDLRAPLRGVTGLTRILLDKHATGLSEEGRKLCAMITDNATAMGLLIDDLLLFCRAGRKTLHVSLIDMTAMVRAVIDELRVTEDAARVDFQVQDLPSTEADPALLRQVWQNLLANAVKFSSKQEHPVVQVRAERKNGQLVYHVQDNGAGFDMRHVHKLFGVFTRLHSSKEFVGTGVGLAIVQQIITRHDGQIWAHGEPDKGATFSFTLN